MKLLRFGERGSERPGLLDDTGVIRDLSGEIEDVAGAALAPDSLARLAALDPQTLPAVSGHPRLGPCVAGTGKFVCIGLNYSDHAAESGMDVPPEPVIFGKWTSAIQGPDDDVIIPKGSEKTDWEVELGVIIGTEARYVEEADAMSHVPARSSWYSRSETSLTRQKPATWDIASASST